MHYLDLGAERNAAVNRLQTRDAYAWTLAQLNRGFTTACTAALEQDHVILFHRVLILTLKTDRLADKCFEICYGR